MTAMTVLFKRLAQPQNPASKPISRHAVTHLGQLPPPEAVKNDSGTVQTVKATAIWWAIRLKYWQRRRRHTNEKLKKMTLRKRRSAGVRVRV